MKIRLPGASEYLGAHSEVRRWVDGQRKRLEDAFDEAHEPAFDKSLVSWTQGWERVNELVATQYAERVTDPEEWQLRYFRWMSKTHWIKFDSERWGEFMMYRKWTNSPELKQAFTVNQAIEWVKDNTVPMIKLWEAFDTFPCMGTVMPRAKRSEVWVMDMRGRQRDQELSVG